MIFLTIIVISLYLIFLRINYKAIAINGDPQLKEDLSSFNVSIVIPYRNESDNLPKLLVSLQHQKLYGLNAEIIFVDDHSADDGSSIINEHSDKLLVDLVMESLPSNKSGKKEALHHGIQKSKYDLIITTDADCEPTPAWLASMVSIYVQNKPDFLSGPVLLKRNHSWLGTFQHVEWMAISALTMASYHRKKPYSANASNLLFNKSLYTSYHSDDLHKHISSGDDIFLLHYAIKNSYSCEFATSKGAIVQTFAENNISDFISQRIRWAGKSTAIRNGQYLFSVLIIFVTNACLLYWYAAGLFSWSGFIWLAIFFIIKLTADSWFTTKMVRFFDQRIKWSAYLATGILYPVYIWVVGITSLAYKPRWKARNT